MRIKRPFKVYTNKQLLSYIDMPISLSLTNQEFQRTLVKLRTKVKGENLIKLDTIVTLYAGLEIIKIKIQEVYSKNTAIYLDKEAYEQLAKFTNLRKETQEFFDKYLDSIDQLEFLDWIANLTYWMAKIESERLIEQNKKFLSEWAVSHLNIVKKLKRARKGIIAKSLLKNILGSKLEDLEAIEADEKKQIDRYGKRVGRIVVNLDEELDLDRLEHGNYSIMTAKNIDKSYPNIIQENDEYIYVDGENWSIEEYYEKHKADFSEDWLTSQDLLKQIISIYFIKRAQSGDEFAFNKLFKLYEDSALVLAKNFIVKRVPRQKAEIVMADAQSAVLQLLTAYLKGDDPTTILKYLDTDSKEKKDVTILLKRKPYEAIMEGYEQLFVLLSNKAISLEEELVQLKKSGKDLKYRAKKAKYPKTKRDYLNKLFSLSQHHLTFAEGSVSLFSLLNPTSIMEISTKHNKFLYQPDKKTNLSTWLFGTKKKVTDKKKIWRGVLWWGLEDWLKRNKNGLKYLEDESYEDESFWDEHKSGSYKRTSLYNKDEDEE